MKTVVNYIKPDGRLSYTRVTLLGMGAYATSIAWALYNNYAQAFLNGLLGSATLVAFIMSVDNIIGIFLIPATSNVSDRLGTRLGRRMPFMIAGIPVAAVMIMAMPFARNNLAALLTIIVIYTIAMGFFRGPSQSLMPDIIPDEHRSRANGLINLLYGLFSAVGLLLGSALYKVNVYVPFFMAGGIMIACLLVMVFKVKEPVVPRAPEEKGTRLVRALKDIMTGPNRKKILILLAVFFGKFVYNGINATFTMYSIRYYGIDESDVGLMIGVMAVTFLVFAFPAGILGQKFGRKRVIIAGYAGCILSSVLMFMVGPLGVIPFNPYLIGGMFGVIGIFWACLEINLFPLLIQGVGDEFIGTATGLLFMADQLASVLGPLALGGVMDGIGLRWYFLISGLVFALAMISAFFVREEFVKKERIDDEIELQ